MPGMSETLTAYVFSVVILAALALFVPCIESLARVLRKPLRDESEAGPQRLESSAESRDVA